jgi:hypothetical protein
VPATVNQVAFWRAVYLDAVGAILRQGSPKPAMAR